MDETRNGKKVYTVSYINQALSDHIASDTRFSNIIIGGELSNAKFSQSAKGYYFSVKDKGAILSCYLYMGYARNLSFKIENGIEVYLYGSVDFYPPYGNIQFKVYKIEKAGEEKGKIFAEYEALKQRLADEGLFDFEYKKELNLFPKSVGVITSSDGAVIHDILESAQPRNPYVQFYLYHCKVQGKGAAQTVVNGLDYFEQMGVDTIILGRGGGSSEELGAFDTEIVARRIFAINIPVISATGHAVHHTLADYVADKRAITPTEAGTMVVADIMSTVKQVRDRRREMDQLASRIFNDYRMRLRNLTISIEKQNPETKIKEQKHRLEVLEADIRARIERKFINLQNYHISQTDRLHVNMINKYKMTLNRYMVDLARLDGLSPTAKLLGGYGYIESEGNPVTSVKDVSSGDNLDITIHDGTIHTVVR